MSFARIQAYLGLDISSFKSGLDKANGMADRFKKTLAAGDIKGPLKEMIGAGAIIAGFSAIINRAQEARDEAAKLGKTVDEGTASVARYADAWDKIKAGIADAGVTGLSFFTRAGEWLGEGLNDHVIARFQGISAERAKEIREISEKAEANAARIGSKENRAAGKKKFEERKKAEAEARKKAKEEHEKNVKEGAEQFEKNRFESLSTEDQIKDLQDKRQAQIRIRETGNEKAAAKARLEQYKLDGQIADKRKELQKEAEEREKKAEEEKKKARDEEKKYYDDRSKRALTAADKVIAAEKKVGEAQKNLAQARQDHIAPTLSDVASGKRGNSQDRSTANRILRDEATARSLRDSRNTISIWDAATQKNRDVGASFFQRRAEDARKTSGFHSSDANPFEASEKALTSAGDELKQAAKDMSAAVSGLKSVEIEIVD